MAVRPRALGLLFFSLVLARLAGDYVAPFFLVVYYVLLFGILLSAAWLFVTFLLLKYHQEFSTEHPVKGESVVHRLYLANESLLPAPFLRVRFKTVRAGLVPAQADFSCALPARGRLEREYTIRCPWRGIYTVGLEGLEARDPLGLFTLRRRAWHRTFYVYPRVLVLRGFAAGLERSERLARGASAAGVADPTLFSRLRGYRPGEALRHVAWKKFASTGVPFIREYDSSAGPGVSIWLDLRRAGNEEPATAATLETEDVSVEILVALVRFCLERGVPVTVRAPGRSFYRFEGSSLEQFPAFHESTMALIFQDTVSPAGLYRYERESGGVEGRAGILITHHPDSQLLALVEESLAGENPLVLILNRSAGGEETGRQVLPYLRSLSERGAVIRLVGGPDTIREDLEMEPRW